jgi:undecaprenyl-diphosphatase
MSIIEAIIFGIVQGVSEFLPISSTAHIVITEHLLDLHFPGLGFEVFLHLASILAVILYFRKDLWQIIIGFFSYFTNKSAENRIHFYFSVYIIIATMITGILGILLEGYIGEQMKSPLMISIALFTTGIFLVIIERFHKIGNRTAKDMRPLDSIIVGLGQTIAIIPGISRSGSTLITALWIGLDRNTAVRYSFLLAIPIILGSSVLTLDEASSNVFSSIGTTSLIIAFITTFAFSLLGIKWLIEFLKRSKLIYFAAYCFVLAVWVYFFLDSQVIIGIENLS